MAEHSHDECVRAHWSQSTQREMQAERELTKNVSSYKVNTQYALSESNKSLYLSQVTTLKMKQIVALETTNHLWAWWKKNTRKSKNFQKIYKKNLPSDNKEWMTMHLIKIKFQIIHARIGWMDLMHIHTLPFPLSLSLSFARSLGVHFTESEKVEQRAKKWNRQHKN